MIQRKITRTECRCEHCGKRNFSPSHMAGHESRCTANPGRRCGFCEDWPAGGYCRSAVLLSHGALRISYPEQETWSANPVLRDREHWEVLVDWLRERCGGCPACMLTTWRLSGVATLPSPDGFDYEDEKSRWWETHRDFDCSAGGDLTWLLMVIRKHLRRLTGAQA